MKKEIKAVSLRLPQELYDNVVELSEANDRSVNKQMIVLLKSATAKNTFKPKKK